MGGKKKLSLKQIEKAQKKRAGEKEKRAPAASSEKKSVPGISSPRAEGDKLKAELKKMKVITPYAIASRFDLRLSVARSFLKELERNGMIEFVSRSRNLQIYKPMD